MTAIVLPDLDRSTLEDLKARMPSLHLSEIELPSMERAGRQADRAIDRLLGRSRPSVWPWVAAGIGIAAIVGTAAALMSWSRRPSWSSWQSRSGSGLPGGTGAGIGADTGIGIGSSTYDDATTYGGTSTGGPDSGIVGDTAYSAGVEVTSLEEPRP